MSKGGLQKREKDNGEEEGKRTLKAGQSTEVAGDEVRRMPPRGVMC